MTTMNRYRYTDADARGLRDLLRDRLNEHRDELQEYHTKGLLTQQEVDRWQQLQANLRDHGMRLHEPLVRYQERLALAVRARLVAQQQPTLLEGPAPEPTWDGYAPRAPKPRPAPFIPSERIELPERLMGLEGATFLDAPAGGKGEKRAWDVATIKAQNPCPDVLARYGIKVVGGKCRCPVHRGGSDESMSVNKTYVNCMHPNCGFAGDVIWLTRALEGLSLDKEDTGAFHTACEVLGGVRVSSVGDYNPRATVAEEPKQQQIDLRPLVAAAADALQRQHSPEAQQAAQYLAERGFDLAACVRFGIGIVDSSVHTALLPLTGRGKHHLGWRNRLTIPDLGPDGAVLYLKGRAFRDSELYDPQTGEKREKYLNPYGMSTRPFRLSQIPNHGDMLLVEGEVDALSVVASGLTESVIAVPGAKSLKPAQAAQLAKRCGRLYLLLDPDVDILNSAVARLLVEAGCDVRLVPHLTNNRDDDLNALLVKWGPERLREALMVATRTTHRLGLR